MTRENVRDTRINLSPETRGSLVTLLNARLADMLDFSLQLKQAHWNVKGRQFVALHEMLDGMHGEANGWADLIAERAVMLGGQARGTSQAVSKGSTLPEYPVEATSMQDHLANLAESLGALGSAVRDAIAASDELGDADTADLFTEVSRGLDKHLWYLEAHLAD